MPVHIPPGGVPMASPMIISETPTHIIVAVEIAKTTLGRHRRFLEDLQRLRATPGPTQCNEARRLDDSGSPT
jgi:hypothetical protein